MPLSDFLHHSDFAFGVFYPRHSLTAVFGTVAPAERAEQALRSAEFDEDQVIVEIAPETEVRVARRAIAGVTRELEEDEESAEPEETAEHEEPTESEEDEPQDEGSTDSGGGDTSNEESRG